MAITVDFQVPPSFDNNPIVTMADVSALPEEIAQGRVPSEHFIQRTHVSGKAAKVKVTVLRSRSTKLEP